MTHSLAQRILDGKYRLIRQLDEGGMASVWFAEHLSLNSPVAVKLIGKEVAETEEGLQRFLREARTAASLRSPHVVQILDYGVDGDKPYIVMELLDGESLADRLERVGRMSAVETEFVIRHVTRAVGRAHAAGIVHRDLKPANIFIIENDDEEIVKLLDFGIAKGTPDAMSAPIVSGTRTGAFLGTPSYVSPEQAQGIKSLDHRTDIWSLGVIAFECLLGELPFTGDTFGSLVLSICSRPMPVPSERGPVPPDFDGWFARACERDPDRRFQTAREASYELRRIVEHGTPNRELPTREARRAASGVFEAPRGAPATSASASSAPVAAITPGGVHAHKPGMTTAAVSSSAITARVRRKPRPRTVAIVAALSLLGLVVLVSSLAFDVSESSTLDPTGAAASPPPELNISSERVAAEPRAVQPSAVPSAITGSTPSKPSVTPAPDSVAVVSLSPAPPRPVAAATTQHEPQSRTKPEVSGSEAPLPAHAKPLPAPAKARSGKPSARKLPSAPLPRAGCDPAWYLDAKGIQRLKPECLASAAPAARQGPATAKKRRVNLGL